MTASVWGQRVPPQSHCVPVRRQCAQKPPFARFQLDQQGHQQPLALHLFHLAVAQNFFKKHPFMCHMLVDDPQSVLAGGQDEGFAQLAQRLQRAKWLRFAAACSASTWAVPVCADSVGLRSHRAAFRRTAEIGAGGTVVHQERGRGCTPCSVDCARLPAFRAAPKGSCRDRRWQAAGSS